ncbi:3-hydroxyisobutyrate dehydrogenase [Streptoalloteichus hindustanus]|uniref:3-hydroxyisobutyrate dehydrogenase n=2 Tax=Streptoalloteichus hindustanus TaxID=2017 RepID=A0A1M5F5U8_STRHI|nr:3-hydroxyisobutyrate dehydrogenase [Streptoalloteichus hindustanus]
MGAALANAFLDQGHPTTVWNRSPGRADSLVARGAHLAGTIAEAVSASPVVVVCVKDYDAVYGVLAPAADALSGRVVVNHSSGTPKQAREAVDWADRHGVEYLDGAIMVPPFAVGKPDSVFLYSGPRAVFDAHRVTLETMGGPRYLGADPGLAVLYNTALLGLMYASMNGFLHAAALVGTAGVGAETFSEIALDWFAPDVVVRYLRAQASEIDKRNFPGTLGTMEMNLTALEHIVHTSAEQGVDAELPALLRAHAQRAIAEGYAGNNYLAMFEVLSKAGPRP